MVTGVWEGYCGLQSISLLSRASRVMCSSLELVQTASDHAFQQNGSPDSEQQKDIQDREQFIFWIGMPQKTSRVLAAHGGPVDICDPCYSQETCWCLWSILLPLAMLMTYGSPLSVLLPEATMLSMACATSWGQVNISFLCYHVDGHGPCYHLEPCWCVWPVVLSEAMVR